MEKKLIFHAGSHKTGTTGLQFFMADNESLLSEKYNIFIPKLERYCPEILKTLTRNIFPFSEKRKQLLAELKKK